jgi:23S rRNA (uracil1939-C5)-methyltransferase
VSPILKIEKIVYPGRRMALDQGKVVFTDGGLPGETVEIEVLKDRASYAEGRTLRIAEASPDRVEPRCGHFPACSPYQELAYEAQLAVKKAQVEEILSRELKIEPPAVRITPSPEIWGYRNRILLRTLWDKSGVRLAYHQPGEENAFVTVDKCHLVPDRTNALLEGIREALGRERWEAVSGVEVRDSRSRGRSLVVFHLESGSRTEEMAARFDPLHEQFPMSGMVGLVRDGRTVREERLGGATRIEEKVRDISYRIGPRSFFQVNVGILGDVFDDMAGEVRRTAPDAVVADLYCGLGTFGLHLAREAREVFGVEPDPANLRYLKKNMSLNKVGNFAVCEGTSEEWLPWLLDNREVGAVILDPPRRGVDQGLLADLAEASVPLVLYLSCNPTTLARDLKTLRAGYRIGRIQVYDFFPHTPHIETLAVLYSS